MVPSSRNSDVGVRRGLVSFGFVPSLVSVVLLTAVLLAYANTLNAPFQFDDYGAIINNASLRDFWSFQWLPPTSGGGSTVSGRPVLALSMALNYGFCGLSVSGYHAVNIAIHAFSTLTLFGIGRRTMRLSGMSKSEKHADIVAGVAAALWGLHPLQTEGVTYIVQRAESLMALFYLLTLYFFLRGYASGHRNRWWTAAVFACLAGMGTKEVMVSAPVILLLFDRAFLASGFREIWGTRKGFYAALMSTWLPLLYLVASLGGNRGGSTGGFGAAADATSYWLTQFSAICTYLKLAVWPSPLVFEYGTASFEGFANVAPKALLVGVLVLATIIAWFRCPRIGFFGLWFLAVLAPTSIVPGTLQTTVEHRAYLALAPLVLIITPALDRWLGRRGLSALGLVAVLFGVLTFHRNEDYRSELSLWSDTVEKRPANARAHHNLGRALDKAGDIDRAMTEYRRAIALEPHHAFAHQCLGVDLLTKGNIEEAVGHLRAAVVADPNYIEARVNLARALNLFGQPNDAIREYQAVLTLEPTAIDARTNLAALLIEKGRSREALILLRAVLADAPELAEAHYHVGMALEAFSENRSQSEVAFREAIRLKPELAEAHLALGNVLAQNGKYVEAESEYRESLRLKPGIAGAYYGLGNLAVNRQDFEAALRWFRSTLTIDARHVAALNNLANCQLVTGRVREAIDSYEQVLKIRPDDELVRQNLQIARENLASDKGLATP